VIGKFGRTEYRIAHMCSLQPLHGIQIAAFLCGVQLETFVPWTLVKRGLRKQIITPLDAPQEFMEEARRERQARESAQDSALLRALGLAYHWQRLLDEQRVGSVAEIAEAEEINVTQVRRLMRLTLLAPEVVERLVGATDIVLEQVMRRPWPNGWVAQMRGLQL